MIFLGCDGGSTKTELLVADAAGRCLAHRIFPGCNYAFLGRDGFARHMRACVAGVLEDAHMAPSQVTAAMFGLPVYGEVPGTEEEIPQILCALLPGCPQVRIENDAVAGWGGSLGGQPGIHVVAGTGSIAYGQDEAGHACRVGGWSLLFSDEGSCSWIGRQVITAFVKQADGRLPRTALYSLVRKAAGLRDNDLYFSQVLQIDLRQDASKLASLQRIALEAARQGDHTMQAAYRAAAGELVQMVRAVKSQLHLAGTPRVSYAGGLFHAGALVLAPFSVGVHDLGCRLVQPRFSPILGAAALAARDMLDAETLERMLTRLDAALHAPA